MPIPAIFKSPYALGALGVVGTGGVSVAGWYALDSLPKTNELPSVMFKSYDCFNKFFPSTEDKEQTSDVVLTSDEMNKAKQKIDPPTITQTTNPVGCISMDLNYDLRRPHLEFDVRLMIKNDKMGLALYANGLMSGSDTSSFDQSSSYTIFFMQNENENWSIKSGYAWVDNGMKGDEMNIHIKAPDGVSWIDHDFNGSNRLNKHGIKHYSGIWEVSSKGASVAALQGVEVWGKDKSKIELFGRTKPFKENDGEGYLSVKGIYSVDKDKWFNNTDANFDIVDVLDKWYDPFRSIQGEWIALENYCSSSSQNVSGVCPAKQPES